MKLGTPSFLTRVIGIGLLCASSMLASLSAQEGAQKRADRAPNAQVEALPVQALPKGKKGEMTNGLTKPQPIKMTRPEELGVLPVTGPEASRVEIERENFPPSSSAMNWVVLKSEGFESSFPNVWQISYNPSAPYFWDDVAANAHSGSRSGWCMGGTVPPNPVPNPNTGQYVNNMNSWMVYGPFDLSDATDAKLDFWYWLDSEQGFDNFIWAASVDNVSYNGFGISGNSNGYVSESFDLKAVPTLGDLTGEPAVYIAFIFQSDGSVTDRGAFLDDVSLEKFVGPLTPDINVTPTSLTIQQTANSIIMPEEEFVLRLKNRPFVPDPAEALVFAEAAESERRYVILQFTALPSLQELAQHDIRPLNYLPQNAVVASVAADFDRQVMATIRWIGRLLPGDKYSAVVSSQLQRIAAPGTLTIMLEAFRDATATALEQIIVNAGGKFEVHPSLPEYIRLVTGTEEVMARLAQNEKIAWLGATNDRLLNLEPVYFCPGAMTIYGPVANFSAHDPGWDGPGLGSAALTYHFDNGTPDISGTLEEAEVERGLNEWARFAQVTFTRSASTGLNRSIDIKWASGAHGDSNPFDGVNGVLAHAFFPAPTNSEPIAGDLHFDEAELWSLTSDIHQFTVALHEAGHSLGLDHLTDPNSVMFASYHGPVTGLTASDIAAIQSVYASAGGSANSFSIQNLGTGPLSVNSISSNRNFLSTSGYPATPFNLAPNGNQAVTVNVDWTLVGTTTQTGTITVASDDPDEPSVGVLVTAIPLQDQSTITVTAPAAGASWTVGTSQTVSWTSANVTGNVNIKLSTDGGSTFPITLASNTANDGSENITVANNPSTTCRVRVESVANTGVFGNNPGNFTIQTQPVPTINVTAPAAGASWNFGSSQNVLWSSSNVTGNVNIKLSTDGGATFPITLASNTANDGSESITVPNNPSSTCRVRVESVANTSVFGDNPGNFTIQASSLNPPRNLTAAAASNAINLNWQAPVTLAASANQSEQIILRASERTARGSNGHAAATDAAPSRTATNIPEQEPNNAPAQAQTLSGASPLIVSGNVEVSDVGAVVIQFQNGSTDDLEDLFLVTTTAAGLQIDLNNFNSDCDIWLLDQAVTTVIDASTNGSTTPEQISQPALAAGTYLVGVSIYDPAPAGPNTTPYTLTLTGQFTGGGSTLQSYNIYRATSSPVPVAAPNRIGNVNASTTAFSDGTASAGVPYFYVTTAVYTQGESGPSNEASAQIAGPSINVSAPAAGASWNAGSTQAVVWTSSNVTGNVNIKLSTDGGTTFPITLASNTANDGNENVTVPNNPSATCRVRVESAANTSVFGDNPGNFTIIGSGGTCDPIACNGAAIFPVAEGATVIGQTIKGRDGDTICVDIRVKQNGQPIDAFGFKLQVDPSQLAFVRVEKGDLTVNFLAINAQENPAGSGSITCGGFGIAAIPANSAGVLLRLCFKVICATISASDLVLSAPADDLLGFATCCNRFECVTCVRDGDVNGDLTLTPGDALCAFQIYLNNGTVPAGCDATGFDCEVTASDPNCDNTTTPGDALAIFSRYLQNLPPLECFARTNAIATAARAPLQLSFTSRTVVASENNQELVKVALRADHPEGLQALGLQLRYPEDKLELLGIARSALTSDWIQLEGQKREHGVVRIGGFNDKPIAANQSGELLEIVFASKDEAINLSDFTLTDLVDDFAQAQVQNVSTSVAANASAPAVFKLHQSYPNPFQKGAHGSEMIIRFDLPGAASTPVELAVYNLAGQLVRHLIFGERQPGAYEVRWDGRNESGQPVPSGKYLYRLKAGKLVESKQLTIVR